MRTSSPTPRRRALPRSLAIQLIAGLLTLLLVGSARASGAAEAAPGSPPSAGAPSAGAAPMAPAPAVTAPPAPAQPPPGAASGAPSQPPSAATPHPLPPPRPRAGTPVHRPAGRHRVRKLRPLARAAGVVTVAVRDFSFGPAAIVIHPGDTVTWVNEGPANHTATAIGSFNTGVLHKGQSALHLFAQAGTFNYFCSIHPFMKATVTVLGASSPAASAPSRSNPEVGSAGGGQGSSASPLAPLASTGSGSGTPIPSGPALPNTGADIRLELAVGGAMLVLGIALRLAVTTRARPGGRRPHR